MYNTHFYIEDHSRIHPTHISLYDEMFLHKYAYKSTEQIHPCNENILMKKERIKLYLKKNFNKKQ